jgi:hypothetical protein
VWNAVLSQHGPSLISPTMAFHDWLSARGKSVGLSGPHFAALVGLVVTAAIAVGGPLLRVPALVAVVAVLLLAYGVGETAYTFVKLDDTQRGASKSFLDTRNWIDKAVGGSAHVAAVLAQIGDGSSTVPIWWDTTFWNKSIDHVFWTTGSNPYGQTWTDYAPLDDASGRIPALDGWPLLVRVADDTRFGLRGSSTVGQLGSLEVIRAQRPYQADWYFLGGALPQIAPGTTAKTAVYATPGAHRVAVALHLPAGPKPVRYSVSGGGSTLDGTLSPGQAATQTLTLNFDAAGRAEVQISVPAGASAPVILDSALPA